MGRRAIDEDFIFEQGDDFRHADAQGEVHHRHIERAGGGGIHHGGLAAGEDIERFAHRSGIGDRAGNARRHDFAFQRPIEKILEVAAEHAEHEFHSQILQHGEIQQRFGDRGLGQKTRPR
jgi:hypothetical protein